jgi:hypothetical protein
MNSALALSTTSLLRLAEILEQAAQEREEKQLASKRSQAAYGETADTDMQIIEPVGAGNTK